ncbi:aldehyde dehydrogenase family protein [Arenibaculum sp.]|uniref:aldehyde dehydrogenase family protein n=1 Tax=Arenibaculum sp. TaxID=2865862 RepID=UPI002E165EE7|nr:aldehyde dehydrogenase family protein [Arenibaculum sp.]
MTPVLATVSPVDGRVYVERPLDGPAAVEEALARASRAFRDWRSTPLERRQELLSRAVDAMVARAPAIAEELTWQMGRPVAQTPGEMRGFEERARFMIAAAPSALAPVEPAPKPGFTRFVRREPVGVVAVVAPWNYPYLTSVNAVIPALAAGNAVILKHSHQTPLCAERYAEAFAEAGLPEGVFQYLHLDHADTERLVADPRVGFVCFTGSVAGGRAVRGALSGRFVGMGLELGGKDPAYVRADADLAHAVENLVDGSFFNSGQSCCGIERIYVHARLHDAFVDAFVETTRGYRLGNPLDAGTTLGPMVRAQAADFVRGQVADALRDGARALVDPAGFPAEAPGTPYMAPQVLVGVDHSMRVMREESFGPVVGIMKVGSDEEAVALMNDSDYGLTASVWTRDEEAALALGDRIETGTVYMNRCDYLDPALAWTGVKDSGIGCTLSPLGYEQLTRPKSFHLRTTS